MEARTTANAVPVLPHGSESDDGEFPLKIGTLLTQSQELLEIGGTETHLVQLGENLVGAHGLVEVDGLNGNFLGALLRGRKVLVRDVGVGIVVVTRLDAFGDGARIINQKTIKRRRAQRAEIDHAPKFVSIELCNISISEISKNS